MNLFILTGAIFSAIYGFITVLKPKVPLFYKIIFYGFGSYLLAVCYSLLYSALMPDASGFHAGYWGYAGLFFFLFSSYYGAMDRLADNGESQYNKYRILAGIPASLIIISGISKILNGSAAFEQLFLIPVAGTAYFSCKHLIFPDIDMGIIRVMRKYNAVILCLCLIQPWSMVTVVEIGQAPVAAALNTFLVILALPLADRGYRKWFI